MPLREGPVPPRGPLCRREEAPVPRGGPMCRKVLCAERIGGGPVSGGGSCAERRSSVPGGPLCSKDLRRPLCREEAHCAKWSYSSMLRGLREVPMPRGGPVPPRGGPVPPRGGPVSRGGPCAERRPSVPKGILC